MPEALTLVAFVLHVASGVVGLLSGILAMTAGKGGRVHRLAGDVFFASMLVMAAFAVYLGFVRPGALINVFIGVFVAYLVATAWIAIRRPDGVIGLSEKVGLAAALILCAPFMLLSGQLALGLPPFFHSALAFKGPLLIAIYLFTLVLAIAAGSDAVVVFSRGRLRRCADCASPLAHVRRPDFGNRLRAVEWPAAAPAAGLSAAGVDTLPTVRLGRAVGLLDSPRASNGLASEWDQMAK